MYHLPYRLRIRVCHRLCQIYIVYIVTVRLTFRMGSGPILSDKQSVSTDTMVNFDGDGDGHGDGTCKQALTRMHSSRMRTCRSLTISWSLLPGRGGSQVPGGESAPRGVSPPRGVCSGGVVSQHALRQTPPLTESQTPVKTLPWPNFVAAGNNK